MKINKGIMKWSSRFLYSFIFLGLLIFGSCSDNNPTSITEEPPEIPPVSSMKMDISLFQRFDVSQKADIAADSSNFQQAISRALMLKFMIDIQLMLPRLLLDLASETKPGFIDGKWVWKYSASTPQGKFSTRLIAVKENGQIGWSSYISSSFLNIKDALFFKGTTNSEGTQGTWTYYNVLFSKGSAKPFTRIKWIVNGKDDISLTLTLLTDFGLNGHAGDEIKYTFDGTVKMLTIYRSETDKTIIIAWNTRTKAGYIIAPNYNNGKKACWNANFKNIPCSEINL